MTLDSKIEALLFAHNESLSIPKLSKLLGVSDGEIRGAIVTLTEKLTSRGIVLIESSNGYILGTHPELAPLFEQMRKEELGNELSKASLETLAIILYKEGATRSDIDYIRGVNSTFILRNLTMRGLIEKREHPDDSRKILYIPTPDVMRYMGITNTKELPDYETVVSGLTERQKTDTLTDEE